MLYMENSISRNNHYVPQMYLQNWSIQNKIWTYQLLVPNENVPIWKRTSVSHTASLNNLYVRIENGCEKDDFEKVFGYRFEAQAADALYRACNDLKMSMDNWKALIDFTAAQIVRTPAFYEKIFPIMKNAFDTGLEEIAKELEIYSKDNVRCVNSIDTGIISLPIKLERTGEIVDESKEYVKISGIIGKSTWLWAIEHLLTNTVQVLHKYKWSILRCNKDVEWPTSDNPVICLNYYADDTYDFGGGWGNPGSEIIFPISPNRALYVQVGKIHAARINLTKQASLEIKKLIIENAFRYIYGRTVDVEVSVIRARTIDLEKFKLDKENFSKWYDVYKSEEGEYYT